MANEKSDHDDPELKRALQLIGLGKDLKMFSLQRHIKDLKKLKLIEKGYRVVAGRREGFWKLSEAGHSILATPKRP